MNNEYLHLYQLYLFSAYTGKSEAFLSRIGVLASNRVNYMISTVKRNKKSTCHYVCFYQLSGKSSQQWVNQVEVF